jgi:hypothetical protein
MLWLKAPPVNKEKCCEERQQVRALGVLVRASGLIEG